MQLPTLFRIRCLWRRPRERWIGHEGDALLPLQTKTPKNKGSLELKINNFGCQMISVILKSQLTEWSQFKLLSCVSACLFSSLSHSVSILINTIYTDMISYVSGGILFWKFIVSWLSVSTGPNADRLRRPGCWAWKPVADKPQQSGQSPSGGDEGGGAPVLPGWPRYLARSSQRLPDDAVKDHTNHPEMTRYWSDSWTNSLFALLISGMKN